MNGDFSQVAIASESSKRGTVRNSWVDFFWKSIFREKNDIQLQIFGLSGKSF